MFTAPVVTLIIIGAIIIMNSVRVVNEYERGVIFRLGRIIGAKGPGLFFLIPIVDRMIKISLRTTTMDIPTQEVITKDNVPAKVNAVCYFRVIDPNKAVVSIENFIYGTSQIAQTTLRSVLGQVELDTLLGEREQINLKLQQIIDQQTEPWGIKVSVVEVKDVQIPEQMQRAIARQAEAERERRAKVINAEGEFQASTKLSQAAEIISKNPAAIQLRFLQTVTEVASEKSTTLVLPIPIDLIKAFMERK